MTPGLKYFAGLRGTILTRLKIAFVPNWLKLETATRHSSPSFFSLWRLIIYVQRFTYLTPGLVVRKPSKRSSWQKEGKGIASNSIAITRCLVPEIIYN